MRSSGLLPVTAGQLDATVDSIAAVQEEDGAIPWFAGGHTDPWDHVESAMALSVAGRRTEAERAYDWLVGNRSPEGTWAAAYRRGRVARHHVETNFCAYVASGVWLHHAVTGDRGFLEALWPVVARAVDRVLDEQAAGGEIGWAVGDRTALLTSCASILTSLRSAAAVGELVGEDRPDWELSADALATAIATRPGAFAPRHRYAMDWYYPVLAGAVGVGALLGRWDDFVADGWGVHCVADEPWVTTAETCELVLALACRGREDDAVRILADVQHLRDDDGAYLTGRNYVLDVTFPAGERTTWSAAAVVLACDALADGPTRALFSGSMPRNTGEDEPWPTPASAAAK